MGLFDVFDKAGKYDKLKKTHEELLEDSICKVTELTLQTTRLKKELTHLKLENRELKNKLNTRIQDKLYKIIEEKIEKDFEYLDDLETHYRIKDRPALKKAKKVEDATKVARECEKKYLLMKYEYECLFGLFPELENYFDNYEENKDFLLDDLKSDYDYVSRYVSADEFRKLSITERNQLALERYIDNNKKSNWQIGRDYELFIAYEYENKGYKITNIGIEKKLEDMGRDIIAENDDEILIIQCKYWSKNKIIHEKHICQLYGTAIQFKREIKTKKKIKPVFITQTQLSEKAKKFAKDLKVVLIENKKIQEFPRIKCNISKNGEKIYHLPFDQQYDKTKIDKCKGESFEYNVIDAELKGFRRAKKYFF